MIASGAAYYLQKSSLNFPSILFPMPMCLYYRDLSPANSQILAEPEYSLITDHFPVSMVSPPPYRQVSNIL